MNYKTRVEIKTKEAKLLLKAITPELEKQISQRSNVSVKTLKDKFIISVVSMDVNALRASVNNILRLVHACEKASKIE